MSTLNDGNFESIVGGEKPVPPELAGDTALDRRLAMHRALKDRLHKAFADVDLKNVLDAKQFIGRAPQQVDQFLAEIVKPIRTRYADALDTEAKVEV